MAHEAVLACGPLKRSRRVYEKGANPAEPERVRTNRASNLSVSDRSCRLPLRVPLYSFAGSGLGSGGFIVVVDLHETARSGVTAYWGCLCRCSPGLPGPLADGLCG